MDCVCVRAELNLKLKEKAHTNAFDKKLKTLRNGWTFESKRTILLRTG